MNSIYKQFEANNESLHRVYHDLKNQIAYIKAETNEGNRASYIAELEKVISVHEAKVNTGAHVLDTLLTSKNLACVDGDIVMTCYADAKQIDFIDVMDICSIFGNALDNAIECERKIEDKDKRLIKVNVYTQNQFLLIRIENYCESKIVFNNEIPDTTKEDKQIHGFGIKSIKRAVGKYRGHVVLAQEDDWVTMTALIPLPDAETDEA
jgi:sensor histidine kinase regulating citrate/malate metabolism